MMTSSDMADGRPPVPTVVPYPPAGRASCDKVRAETTMARDVLR